MSKKLRRSPLLLVAVLSLVVAFGTTAVAGPPSLSAAKKKKSKHSDKKQDTKLFNSLLKAAAPGLSVKSAATAASANSASEANHAKSADSATTAGSAQPVAFATVSPNGGSPAAPTVTNAKNITAANFTHPGNGSWCLSGLPFTIKGAQVTQQFGGSYNASSFFTSGTTGNCPSGNQIVTAQGGSPGDNTFTIVVYG